MRFVVCACVYTLQVVRVCVSLFACACSYPSAFACVSACSRALPKCVKTLQLCLCITVAVVRGGGRGRPDDSAANVIDDSSKNVRIYICTGRYIQKCETSYRNTSSRVMKLYTTWIRETLHTLICLQNTSCICVLLYLCGVCMREGCKQQFVSLTVCICVCTFVFACACACACVIRKLRMRALYLPLENLLFPRLNKGRKEGERWGLRSKMIHTFTRTRKLANTRTPACSQIQSHTRANTQAQIQTETQSQNYQRYWRDRRPWQPFPPFFHWYMKAHRRHSNKASRATPLRLKVRRLNSTFQAIYVAPKYESYDS